MINLFLFSNLAWASYTPLQGIEWKSCNEAIISIQMQNDYLPVSYRYCSSEGTISFEFIKKEIAKASESIFEFARKNGLKEKSCASNIDLEIYQVKMSVLNNSKFENYHGSSTVWGLYDPRVDEVTVSSIILTDHGNLQNRLTLAHELSHYWFDRMCWSYGWTQQDLNISSNETFARKFEFFYKNMIQDN